MQREAKMGAWQECPASLGQDERSPANHFPRRKSPEVIHMTAGRHGVHFNTTDIQRDGVPSSGMPG